MAKKSGLGRGLEHLIDQSKKLSEMDEQEIERLIKQVDLSEVKPNPYQPRKTFDEKSLSELADSIKQQGLFQPILVRKALIGYEIISGERRTRAAKIAGLTDIPAIVYDYNDEQMMEVALVENIQREDLTAVEEAKSYQMVMKNLNLTQEEIAKKVGKSRAHIANTLRLLKLDNDILALVEDKQLTMGHVKVLVNIDDKKVVKAIVAKVLAEGLSVRQTEELARVQKETTAEKKKSKPVPARKNNRLEKILREKLETKVRVLGEEKGTIEISFSSQEDLERLLGELKLV